MFLYNFMICYVHKIRITPFNQQPYYHGTQHFVLGAFKEKICARLWLCHLIIL